MTRNGTEIADTRESVAAIYERKQIATSYLDKRLRFSWQRLLHRRQVACLNAVLAQHRPDLVLEVAPGPARLTTDLTGVTRGVMVENSDEMVAIARERLAAAGLSSVWDVKQGDAFKLHASVEESSVSLAFTFRFLRHFRAPERQQLYGELRRALKPGGHLVFDVVGRDVLERIEARGEERPAGEIAIYDVSYSADDFRAEMASNGFDVVQLVPVLRHFQLQSFISGKADDVLPRVAELLVGLIEAIPSSEPLEWVAVCRKR